MTNFFSLEIWQIIKNIVDICAVAYVFYFLYSLFENTNTMSILKGFIAIIIINAIARIAGLRTLEWIFQYVMNNFVLLIVVLFQPEIRKILNRIGEKGIAGIKSNFSKSVLREITDAVFDMSDSKTGALIIIEQNVGLKHFLDNSVILNSDVTKEGLLSIFYKGNPLHDGAVIISEEKILAARVIIPSVTTNEINNKYGTRHRAGLFVSEDSDAISIIVSEERGSISIAYKGHFEPDLKKEEFLRRINELLGIQKNNH
ncbi:MAG: diadenylate cyclase CdaA [Brevinematales bacterium]|nr:diadenylate cyclase CdaA [Brevinematales bacterium]